MELNYNQIVAALRSVDVALDIVVQEEDRLIGILNSEQASSGERFQALVDCVALTQKLQTTLVEAKAESEPARNSGSIQPLGLLRWLRKKRSAAPSGDLDD